MLIFSPHITPRLNYACEVLFGPWQIPWNCTADPLNFAEYPGIKFNYSDLQFSFPCIHISPEKILFEKGISPQEIKKTIWRNRIGLFANSGMDIPFDLFAATFFLVSRYEEYLPFKGDKMGRFEVSQSFSNTLGILQSPEVDHWRMQLQEIVLARWPETKLDRPNFHAISTIDVDSAFAYRHKGVIRTLGGYFRDLLNIDIANLTRRTATLFRSTRDVYETYALIEAEAQRTGIETKFFFLLADFGTYDKNVPHSSNALRKLIRRLNCKHTIGIHPGIGSHANKEILKKEINRLRDITGQAVHNSRQHYLKLQFPETYRNLIDAEITDDYSMGYASDTGFRAGTSNPFRWYDLEKETTTKLTIHPFAAMDATLRNYLKLSPDAAVEHLEKLIQEVASVNGTFISLWHNESLSETAQWIGYSKVYSRMLDVMAKMKADNGHRTD